MGMQKTKKQKSPGSSVKTKRGKGFLIVAGLAAIGVMVAAALLLSTGKKTEEGSKQEKISSSAPAPGKEARSDLQKLVGRWLRPDGGYVIEVRSIGANGKLDAGYFNPRPINVSRAEAWHKGNDLKVFIELQDVGYPGSTYNLTYDPPRDVLRGVYFHAGLSQTFDVVFVRTE
jgi:hypothetical protein